MTTALATKQKDVGPVRAILENVDSLEKIRQILPAGLTVEEVQRTALMAVHANPKLAECTPASVLLSVMRSAQFGVVVDGRHAHLIPYKRSFKDSRGNWTDVMEAQFQWDYKGLIQKIRQAPEIRDIYAEKIHAQDPHRVLRGSKPSLEHEIHVGHDRGPIVAFYSVVTYKDGSTAFDIMTIDEVDAIRKRSKSYDKKNDKSSGPWDTDFAEMGKKTVVKRHAKYLPLPSDILGAVNADNEDDPEPIKPANAREVTPATIPSQPAKAVAETTPEPEPVAKETEAPPKAKAVAEPEARAEKSAQARVVDSAPAKKMQPKATTPPPAEETVSPVEEGGEPTVVSKCQSMLAEAGFTPADLIRAAQRNDWLSQDIDAETAGLDVLGDDLVDFIHAENWPTMLVELKKGRK